MKLETTIKKLSPSQLEIYFKVPTEELAQYIEKTKTLGEASTKLINDAYLDYIKKENIEPISSARTEIIKIVPGAPAEFKVIADILPLITLPDYQTMIQGMEKKAVSVSAEQIKEALSGLQKMKAKFTDLNRPAEKGDFIHIEYSSSLGPDKQSKKDEFVLGQGKLIPGFEDQLVGTEVNQEKEFDLIYPDPYFMTEMAGQKAHFKAKTNKVQQIDNPPLDDDFAKQLGDFETIAQLKIQLEANLKEEFKGQEEDRWRKDVSKKISEQIKTEVPAMLIEAEENRLLNNLKQNVKEQLKISFDDYLKQVKQTEEQMRQAFSVQAEDNVKRFLFLREIGKKEEIQVSEEEVQEKSEQILKELSSEQAEKVEKKQLEANVYSSLFAEKVFQRLASFIKREK
jgi:trigger factor